MIELNCKIFKTIVFFKAATFLRFPLHVNCLHLKLETKAKAAKKRVAENLLEFNSFLTSTRAFGAGLLRVS